MNFMPLNSDFFSSEDCDKKTVAQCFSMASGLSQLSLTWNAKAYVKDTYHAMGK